MRNLKRALSLALASVMVMGMMVVGTSAVGYKDVSSEQNQEAIEVLQAVGIMTGDENGKFNPDANVTRNEMAVIMSNLLNLDYDYYRGVNKFTDVPEWAAPYVAACVAEGVTAGIGNNQYGGSNNVTAAQAALMLMKTLGYFQYAEDFGEDWQVATVRQASYIDLFDGVKANAETALTRNQVAQMVLNALEADMVEFTGDTGSKIELNGVSVNVGYRAEYTARSSSDDKYDTLVGGATDIDRKDRYIIQLGEELYDGKLVKEDSTDDFGRPSTTWNYKKVEIGTYADKGDLVATYTKKVTKANVYADIGKSVYDDLSDGDSRLTVYFDGVKTSVAAADIDTYAEKNNTGKVNSTGNGDLTEIYVDDDHNVTIVTIRTYVFQAASDYDSKKETVNLTTDSTKFDTSITLDSRTLDADDFEEIVDLKADDYVLVTATKNSAGKYEVQSVAKAETVTEEITGYKWDDSVDANGTTYSYNAGTSDIKQTNYTVGKPATLVLDSYGYVIAVDEALVLSDYVYIKEFANPNGLTTSAKAVAYAIFPDGTYEEIVVKEAYNKVASAQEKNKSTIGSWGATATQIGWFTYSKNSAGEYTLYPIESKYTEETAAYTQPGSDLKFIDNSQVKAFISDGNGTTKADDTLFNDDTVVIVSDKNNDLSVYTGVKNAPTITLTASGVKANVSVVEKTSNGYASLVYIDIDGAATISGGKDSNLVYVVSYDGKYVTTDNEVYYKYTVLDENGEKVKVEADTQIASQTGKIYRVANYLTENSDGRLTDFALVSSSAGVVIGGTDKTNSIIQSAGTLTIGGQKYLVDEDAKIALITMGDLTIKPNNVAESCDATVMNKDKDADHEGGEAITAKELADALKGYNYTYDFGGKVSENAGNVITELYVTVKTASNANADVAEVGTITVAPSETSAGYDTIKEAVENAITVSNATSMTIFATGTGTMDYKVTWGATVSTADSAITNVPASGWQYNESAGVYLVKVTATSADGTAHETKYVGVKPVTYYTLTVKNSDTDCAVMVNGEVISANETTGVVVADKLTAGQTVKVEFVKEDGKNIGAPSVTAGGATLTTFNGVMTITVGSANVEITFADAT